MYFFDEILGIDSPILDWWRIFRVRHGVKTDYITILILR